MLDRSLNNSFKYAMDDPEVNDYKRRFKKPLKEINENFQQTSLNLGSSVARNFVKRKQLLDRGQKICIQITSDMHQYVLNANKLLADQYSLQKLEKFVDQLELVCHNKNVAAFDREKKRMENKILDQEEEINRLEVEKSALLDEIIRLKQSPSFDTTLTTSYFD